MKPLHIVLRLITIIFINSDVHWCFYLTGHQFFLPISQLFFSHSPILFFYYSEPILLLPIFQFCDEAEQAMRQHKPKPITSPGECDLLLSLKKDAVIN